MKKTKNVTFSGVSFGGLLTLVFVAAKLWHQVDWSWFWVCSPLWMPAVAVLAGFAAFFIVVGALWLIASTAEAIGKAIKGRRDNDL